MEDLQRDAGVVAELFVRRDLPRPSQRRADAIDAELRALAGDGEVAEYRQKTWTKRVRVDDCASDVRDRYLRFSAWATSADVSLQPFFDTRERYDTEAEAYTDCIVLPTMTLAVAVDGELSAVYPHAEGDDTVTVEDGVAALGRDEATTADESVVLAD